MMELERYYTEFREFKNFFVKIWSSIKRYEVYKVWAQWLIRGLCKVKNNYHLIPKPQLMIDDTHIIEHLKEKGVNPVKISHMYEQIIIKLSYLYDKYNEIKISHLNSINDVNKMEELIKYEKLEKNGKIIHVYRCGMVFVKYYTQTHEQLLSRYRGHQKNIKFCMFEMGFNYYMLEGHSFQWCVPPKVFSVLEKMLSTKTEFFASPINVSLPNYYSLFSIDQYFGANGNLFYICQNDIKDGTFEVNPPFIEYIFIESSKMVKSMLTKSQENDQDLMFIYIMPNWLDSVGYKMLINSEFLLEEIVLPEKSHFYHQSYNRRMILANFKTHILVIGTRLSRKRWTHEIKHKFIENFTHY